MKRNYKIYLKDITESMEDIENFVGGLDFDEFQDDKTSSAVMRKFEIIREATKQLPDEIREKYPEIPWKEMAGMRDRLIHFYFGWIISLFGKPSKIGYPMSNPYSNML